MSNIFDPANTELNIQNTNSSDKDSIINQNLGQYLDISYDFILDRNSLEKKIEKKIDQTEKFNNLKSYLLNFLNSKYPKGQFNEGDITNYFNNFKSPYHKSTEKDKFNEVKYTSGHLSRLLKEEQWIQKNKKNVYNGKRYKKQNDNNIYFLDESHLGIDLTLSGPHNFLYPTQFGDFRPFPGDNGGLGNVVAIQHKINKNGTSFLLPLVTIYAHMYNISINSYQEIAINTSFGNEGSSPVSFGYPEHLHLELWKTEESFNISSIQSLASIRNINSRDVSYNYRYINATYESFEDKTAFNDFYEVDEKGIAISKQEQNLEFDSLNIRNRSISKNIFLNGISNEKGIKDISLNIIDETDKSNQKKYYNITENIKTKRIILDEYSFKNQNTKDSNFLFFNFSNTEYVMDENPLNIKLNFKSLLDKKDEHIATNNIQKNNQTAESTQQETPIFSFYFPLRFNIFQNNYNFYSIGSLPRSDIFEKLQKSLEHYYIKFDILDIDFNDILNLKYDKVSSNFSMSKNIKSKNKTIPDGSVFYVCKIIKSKPHSSDFDDLTDENEGSIVIFDHDNTHELFKFTHKIEKNSLKKNKLKIEVRPDSTYERRDAIRQLMIIEKDPSISYEENPVDEGIDYRTNQSLSHFFKAFINIDKPALNILADIKNQKDNPALLNFLKNSFSENFRMYFKERYNNDRYAFDESRSELPNSIISNIYDTTFYNDTVLEDKFKNLSIKDDDKKKNLYETNLTDNYFLIDTKKDSPLKGIEAYPFVESQFFSHRISSTYLPKKLYGVNFKKFKKVFSQSTQNDKGFQYYWYKYDDEYTEKRETGDEDYFFKPQTQNTKAHSIYKLEIDLDELYFEIIYNMINIDIYNIED